MKNGRRISENNPGLEVARHRARQQIDVLPPQLRSLENAGWSYPVVVSSEVARDLDRLRHANR